MTEYLTFEECDSPEKMEELNAFAATFTPPHKIHENGNRIIIVKRNGLWIGYLEVLVAPVVFSAWSTERTKPQDIKNAMRTIAGWGHLQFNGKGFAAVTLDTKTFPEPVMNKLGFYRVNHELYGIINQA